MILLQYRSVKGFEYFADGHTLADPDWHEHTHADDDFESALDYYRTMNNDWAETRLVYQDDNDKLDQVILDERNTLPGPSKSLFSETKFWARFWPAIVWIMIGLGYTIFWSL